jgi:hypothetical protein
VHRVESIGRRLAACRSDDDQQDEQQCISHWERVSAAA